MCYNNSTEENHQTILTALIKAEMENAMSTTTTTKFTKKMDFTSIVKILESAQENSLVDSATATRLIARMNSEMELLAKKNSAERKPTKTQIANVGLAKQILDLMNLDQIYTATEILKKLDNPDLTLPKVTAVIRPMLTVTAKGEINPNGVIVRFEEKGRTYFRKLDTPEAEED
jgi:hypothetical protein